MRSLIMGLLAMSVIGACHAQTAIVVAPDEDSVPSGTEADVPVPGLPSQAV